MDYNELNLKVRIPNIGSLVRRLPRTLLPTPGNVIFTVLIVGCLLWANSVGAFFAPVPFSAASSVATIPYQGRLADSSGNPLTSTVNMEFRLYTAASGSTPLWSELWTGSNGVRVSDGLFNVMLGSLTPIPQNAITANSSLWLGITVGTDGEMAPRVQLGSVPYAVQALTVPDSSIASAKLADGSVTTQKLGIKSVTSATIADSGVAAANLAPGSVNGTKLGTSFGASNRPLLNFVPRDLPITADREVRGTMVWTTWDLQSIVGPSATAVIIYIRSADDVSGSFGAVRSGSSSSQHVSMASGLNAGQYKGYGEHTVIITGGAPIIEISSDDVGGTLQSSAQFSVVGWYEPANK